MPAGLLLALVLPLLSSCSAFSTSLAQALEEDLTSRYVFYAVNPEESSVNLSVSRSYNIGSTLDLSSLSFSELTSQRSGYSFVGWKYYQNPSTGSEDIPETMQLDDDQRFVTEVVVTPSPASFYGVWQIAYEDYGTVAVTILVKDIALTTESGGDSIVIHADEGYEKYSWTVDGVAAASFTGASLDAAGSSLTLKKADLQAGYVYQISLYAEKNGIPYSSQLQVEVSP